MYHKIDVRVKIFILSKVSEDIRKKHIELDSVNIVYNLQLK